MGERKYNFWTSPRSEWEDPFEGIDPIYLKEMLSNISEEERRQIKKRVESEMEKYEKMFSVPVTGKDLMTILD